jgi:UDP-galactose transporter B1
MLAMYCSNESIKWVAYPTQALGKSVKIAPVMLFNVLLAKRRYSLRE